MKRRNIIVCSICMVLVIILIVLLGNNKSNTFISDGVTYALTVDGVSQKEFPSKGLYRVEIGCTNATCKWDYEEWKLYIENISGDITCDISFTTISKTNFNDYIIGLSGTAQGIGSVVQENGYRYEGQDPNNYVWFNNELWRIIGVFDETSHGQTGLNLVKIIRNESIGGLAWHKSNTNNWNVASLKALLNTEYLNSTDGTNGNNCYGDRTIAKAKCDYTSSGLKNVQSMIQEVTWYLGGYSGGSITTEEMYRYERDETSKYGSNLASINANVGLMYASDYGYAVPAANCARTTMLSSYNSASCTLNNWLYGNGFEWTITPYTSTSYNVINVNFAGSIVSFGAYYGHATRPSVYLKSSVYVIDGTGSKINPYIIGM